VVPVCEACGAALPTDARFCPTCGTPVPGPGPASRTGMAEGVPSSRERKVATLLFADLVGFTALGEAHDPELVGALVGRVFERLSEEIRRYEGTIEKFAGDAMLAAFGVPSLHEDDAERAVRAGLEMQAAVADLDAELRAEGRPGVRLRIGVESGEVLVDLARAAGERDLFVTGDAVNTAARLQAVATPGAVVVGPVAWAATRSVIEYEELPAAVLKGKELPVAAWRAIAVRARRGGERAPLGLEAPLVGRDEELGLLKETVRRAVAEGRPHLLTVVGSAGVGKSRLAWELEKYLDGLPEPYHWRKGRCLAYAQASYSALADVLKADAGIMDDDAPESGGQKVAARLLDLGGSADGAVLEALRAVLALGPASALPRDELFDAWRRYLELVAARAPLVMVIEDIHWADEGLLDFVEYAARWAAGPIVILSLARHELLERRPAWAGGLPNAATIVLEPLDEAESGRLVDGLLAGGLPEPLRSRVVTLADGNPLFAEELVRMFVDRGVLRFADGRWELAQPVDEVEVPGSVQAVLAARLDTLPGPEKQLAQRAAVVGRIFWDAVIAHLMRQGTAATNELLRRLRVKELVVPRAPSALAGASEFGFRHVLIRDVAYETLPKRDRATLHLDVARWAEQELAERHDEFAELLASHYLASLRYEEEFAEPGSARVAELRRRTFETVRRAADRAEAVAESQSAAHWLRIAVELGRTLELSAVERADLALRYAECWGHDPHEEKVRALQEALAAVDAEGAELDDSRRARLEAYLGRYQYSAGLEGDARRTLRAALARREGGKATEGRALVLHTFGWLCWRAGPLEEAPALLERAVEEARATGSAFVERNAMHDLGVALAFEGRSSEAIPLLRTSFRLARETGDQLLLTRSYVNLPAILDTNGADWHEMLDLSLEGLELARRSVDRSTESWIAGNIGDSLAMLGRLHEALTYQLEALEAVRHLREPVASSFRMLGLAWVRRLLGDLSGAREAVAEAASIEAPPEPQAAGASAARGALIRWADHDDPIGATAELAAALDSLSPVAQTEAGPVLARMALRVGRTDLGILAAGRFLQHTAASDGPRRLLERRWASGLLESPERAVRTIGSAAAELDASGWRVLAADAWADAALIAARAGIPSAALEQALTICEETGLHPALGPLPETRWIVAADAPPAPPAPAATATTD
jgi:class 3 adenylate cyclase/tetratricopeptide (TPR) repeat protein